MWREKINHFPYQHPLYAPNIASQKKPLHTNWTQRTIGKDEDMDQYETYEGLVTRCDSKWDSISYMYSSLFNLAVHLEKKNNRSSKE